MQIKKPRRIIEITLNDAGRQFGCYGAAGNFTPHIDKMAAEGVRFAEHFSVASVCMPSRLGILTGKYVHHTHLYFCDPNEQTIPKLLGNAGYRTILCGEKEHNSYKRDPRFGYTGDDIGQDIVGFSEHWSDSADGAWIANKVCNFLNSSAADEPFFLCANLHEAHARYWREPSEREIDEVVFPPLLPGFPDTRPSRKQFASFCKHLAEGDRAVGQILDCIRVSGKEDDTLVVFTVDHGIDFPRAKQTLYDSGVNTPLILWGPAWLKPGVVNGLSCHCDILPTLCELTGIVPPPDLDGVSLVPAMEKGETARSFVFLEKGWDNPNEPIRGIRTKQYKYIKNYRPGWPIPAVKSYIADVGADEYIARFARLVRPAEELYDLVNDPSEQDNLAENPAYAQIKSDLNRQMTELMVNNKDELLNEQSIYTINAGNPAVRYWKTNTETGEWALDFDQPFIVLMPEP